jgi:hypothetical protein
MSTPTTNDNNCQTGPNVDLSRLVTHRYDTVNGDFIYGNPHTQRGDHG